MDLPGHKQRTAMARFLGLLAGPGLMILARVGGALAGMAFTLLLARTLGVVGTGQVSVAIALAMVLALACTLNLEAGAVRFMVQDIARGHWPGVAGYVRFSRRSVLAISIVVTAIATGTLWLAGYGTDSHLYLAVLAAPVLGWMRLGAGIAQGFSRPVLSVLPRTLLRPVFMLIAVGGWLLAGLPLDPWTATALFLAATVITLLAQDRLLRPDLRILTGHQGDMTPDTSQNREWVRIGLTLGLNVLFIEYSIYVTVLCAALVLPAAETARLDVLLKLIALLRFGLIAINQYYMPAMSRALGQDDRPALERLIAASGALRLLLCAVGAIGLLLFGRAILGLFGPEYAVDQPLLLALLLEASLIAVLGPGSNVLGLSRQPQRMLPILLGSLATLCLGTLILGHAFGLAGVISVVILMRAVWQGGTAMQAHAVTGVDTTVLGLPSYLWQRGRQTGGRQ